jgi:hypothetical protein
MTALAANRQGFTQISNDFLSRPDIDPTSKTILNYLASNHKRFTPSQNQIARAAGVSARTIRRRLRILEARGVISRAGLSVYNVVRWKLLNKVVDRTACPTSPDSLSALRTTTQNNNNFIPKGGGVIHASVPDRPPDPPPPPKEKDSVVINFPAPAPREPQRAPVAPRRRRTRQNRNMSRSETARFLCRKERVFDLYKPFFVKKGHRRLWSLIEHDWIKHTPMEKLISLGDRLHDMAGRGEIRNPGGFMSRSISNFRGDWREFLGYLTERAGS